MSNAIEPNPWSSDTLLAKAQLYIEQMNSTVADEWKYGLWSALSLELLARAALAHISPVLLADAQNWRNIMHALGKAPTAKKFTPTSIGTKEVLVRLNELLPDFNQEVAGFCSKHVERRNAELHSGEIVFTGLGTAEWLPKFYRSCKILLESMGKQLADFVSDPERALEMIASLNDAAAKAVDQDIKAHATVWSNKLEEERKSATLQATAWATRHAGHRVSCPSCASPAILHGNPSGPVSTRVGDDEVIQRQTMLPSAFECIACGLKISGYSKLSACGLGDAFSSTTTYTAAEFFDLYTEEQLEDARNEIPEYEPDFNEY
ncbi:hypothetical protein [Methylosarcina fibrata]|uniref:hypothetical protein n=1 Tax=Methylosarcina fibrata TaxID=105972 RepID=UPI00035D3BCF|nr:hypothetical protein [Methylosarcina fibrata]